LLAYRSDRLAAVVLDSVSLGIAGVVAIYAWNATSLSSDASRIATEYASWSLFLAVQAYFLTTRGQTLGKLFFHIRIVRSADGGPAGFARAVLLRYIVPELLLLALTWRAATGDGHAPFAWISLDSWPEALAMVLQLADVLFIFTADRRCLHDRLAGTKVIRVLAPRTHSS
jgi:uncharacterized RDD family membrane protein YckC